MRDLLTRKRIKKVNYLLIIKLAGLESKYVEYLLSHRSCISDRRKALCFLQRMKVNLWSYQEAIKDGVLDRSGYLEWCRKIAQTSWL